MSSGETPPLSPHSPSWTAVWLQWSRSDYWASQFLRTWSGTITLSPWWKRPSRGCTSFASWGSSTCHRSCWYSSTLLSLNPPFNNCLVQLSDQIWPQKTTEGSPDCWANHWYNPPHCPGTVLIQSEKKGWQNPSGPFTSSSLPLWTATVWLMLQSSEHQNDQTQKQFISPSNPSHEYLTLNVEHTTPLYNYLFITHTYFFHFKFAHSRPGHT